MEKIINILYSSINTLDHRLKNLSNRQSSLFIFVFSIFLFFLIFKLNVMTPMWVDDFFYSLSYTGGKLSSLNDIFVAQYHHYFNNGGRSVVHFFAQLLLMCPPYVADAINSFIFILFIVLIYYHAKGREKKQSLSLFILIFIAIWFLQPALAETVLWTTGAANYLWGMFIVLLYLLPYRFYNNKGSKYNALKSLLFFVFGIIAGWTNENISVALIVMLFLWLLYWKKKSYHIPVWAIVGLIGVIIGCCLLLLAPGNFVRASSSTTNHSLFAYYYKFNVYSLRFMYNLGYFNIITSILLILVLKFSNISKKSFLSLILILVFGLFVSIYSMMLSPTFPGRAWFGIISLNIIIFSITYYKLNNDLKFIRYIKYLILSISLIAFIFTFYYYYKEIKAVDALWHQRELMIQEAIKNKETKVEIFPIIQQSKYTLGDGPWISDIMSNYYGIEVVMH